PRSWWTAAATGSSAAGRRTRTWCGRNEKSRRVGRVFEAHRHSSGGPRRLGPPYRKTEACTVSRFLSRVAVAVALVGFAGSAVRAQDPLVEPPKPPAVFRTAVEFALATV